jgi:PleD family two-component response regulator
MEMTNLEALINQADAAMYAAKDAGRNCVVSL